MNYKKLLSVLNKDFFLKLIFKVYSAIFSIYNMFILFLFLGIINFFSLYKKPLVSRFIWDLCFFFLYKNAGVRFYSFINFILNAIIIIFYSILIFFFSFSFYFIFIILFEEFLFSSHIFACNKALLFFFFNVFFYALFFERDFFFSELEFSRDELGYIDYEEEWGTFNLEFENSDVGDDNYIETEEDNDATGDDDDYNINMFKKENDYSFVETFDDLGLIGEAEDFDDDEYETEFLEGIYFFDRWLGLSNELLLKIYSNNDFKLSFSNFFFERLKSNSYSLLLDKELKFLFYFLKVDTLDRFIFRDFKDFNDLLKSLLELDRNNIDLSDTLILTLQVESSNEEDAYEDIYIASLSNPNLDYVRGFFNKFYVSNKQKLTFLSYYNVNTNFSTAFNYDNLATDKFLISYRDYKGLDQKFSLSSFEYKDFNSSFSLYNFKILNYKIHNNKEGGFDYEKINGNKISEYLVWSLRNKDYQDVNVPFNKRYKILLGDKYLSYIDDDSQKESFEIKYNEVKSFLNFFIRIVIQEKFDEDNISKVSNLDTFLFKKGFFSFFFFSFLSSFSILTRFFFIDFFLALLNKFPSNNNLEFQNLISRVKKDNDLILLLYMWQNYLNVFPINNKNLQFYDFFRYYLSTSSFDQFMKDYFYSFNTEIEELDDFLMNECDRNYFENEFDFETRPLLLLSPFLRSQYLNNSYSERALYLSLDGNFEYDIYLPNAFLKPVVSYKRLKYEYFYSRNRNIDYQKRKKYATYVSNKKDAISIRFNKYFLFYLTKFIFFIFDFRYWYLRFIPFLLDVFKVYGYGGTFIESNNKTYSGFLKKLYKFGINLSKGNYDTSSIISPIRSLENKFPLINPYIKDTSNFFPDIIYGKLSIDFIFKFNIYFDLFREFELSYLLIFLNKEFYISGSKIKLFFKRLEVNDWLFFDSSLFSYSPNNRDFLFYNLFFSLSSSLLKRKIKQGKPIISDPVLKYFENERKKKLIKVRKKRSLKQKLVLIQKKIYKNYYLLRKRNSRFNNKNRKVFQGYSNVKGGYFNFCSEEKEILSIFFNKTWLNEYNGFDYEDENSLDEYDFLQGGLYDFDGEEDNIEISEIIDYNTFVWDWQTNNWETVLNLFLDVDRFFNVDEVDELEESNNVYYTLFVLALFFWLYCRLMRFINYNDSELLPYILKYTRYDSSISAYRFFFENILRSSSGRSRILGENYIGVNRRLFHPFVSTSYWIMLTPVTKSIKDFDRNFKLAIKSQFAMRKMRMAFFFREQVFKTHLDYGKGFYLNENARNFKYFTLHWVLYGRLKRLFNFHFNSFNNNVDLTLLKEFFLTHRNPREKRRRILKKRKNFFPILRAKFLSKFLGYNPLRYNYKRSTEKYLNRLYRKTIIKYADKKHITPFEYEVYFGGYDTFSASLKRVFYNLMFIDDNFLQYENRFRKFIGEHLYFNLLKKNYRDKNGELHYDESPSDLFTFGIFNSLMRNHVQYRYTVRKDYNQAIYKLPALVGFLANIPEKRRNSFLNQGGFYNFFIKYLLDLAGDDFIAYNNKNDFFYKSKTLDFSNWFNFLYKRPFDLFLIDKKVKSNNGILNKFFNTFFFSSYAWDLESWLDFNQSDLDLNYYKKYFKYGYAESIPFAGHLSLERIHFFINNLSKENGTDEKIKFSQDLMRRAFLEPELDFRYYFLGKKRTRYLFFREFTKKPNYYLVKDNVLPVYRFFYNKESWWTAFNLYSFFSNEKKYVKEDFIYDETNSLFFNRLSNFRKFRIKSYKKFYLESLFNLGRQYIDYLEGENGYNRTLDYFTQANTNEFFDDIFNSDDSSKSYHWYLGNSDLYHENKRHLWHLPTWIWSFILRRHLGNIPNSIPNYIVHYGMLPGFNKTNTVTFKGKYFYNNRRYKSNPLEITFEESQFPAEEGFLGGIFVPSVVRLLLEPFFSLIYFIRNYFSNNILSNLARIPKNGDVNNRPNWMVFVGNSFQKDTSILNIKRNLYNDYLGNNIYYDKFRFLCGDKFLNSDRIKGFDYLTNLLQTFIYKLGKKNEIQDFKYNTYKKKVNTENSIYFPFKPLFRRNNYFYFNNLFIYILLYLMIYYFVWIPLNYLTYVINHWFDDDNSYDAILEDNLDYREDFYYELLNIPNNSANIQKEIFYDYNFRSPVIVSDIDIFIFLINLNSSFNVDIENSFETFQFHSMDTSIFQLYGFISYHNLRTEYLDFFLIKLYDYNKFSYNLLDIFNFSKNVFYKDKMKGPIPENRAVFTEFLNLLTGHESSLIDSVEEYKNNILAKSRRGFVKKKNQNYLNFLNGIKTKNYLGDGVFLNKKKKKKSSILLKKKYSNIFLNNWDDFMTENLLNENSLRNTVWGSVNFFKESLDLMGLTESIFLCTESNLLATEKINISILYYSENFSFCPYGKWGFLKYGSFFETILQYRPGEVLLPFYFRFLRYDEFSFNNVLDYNDVFREHCLTLENTFIKSNYTNNLEFKALFDVKDITFVHRINNEANMFTEYTLNMFFNFQNYLHQAIVKDEYKFIDNFILNEHSTEMLYLYSNDLFSEMRLSDLDLFDWEIMIEQSRDWLICYPNQDNNLKVELRDFPNIYAYMYDYFKDEYNRNLDRNYIYLFYSNQFDFKFKIRNFSRKTFYNLRQEGYSKIMAATLANSSKYWWRNYYYNEGFEEEIEMKPFSQPDAETDELLDEIEFPDKYTMFSKYFNYYQTDFFSSLYFSNNNIFNQIKIKNIDDNSFIRFYILQYFNKNIILDINQRYMNVGSAVNYRFNELSTNQLIYYNHYKHVKYKRLLLLSFQNNLNFSNLMLRNNKISYKQNIKLFCKYLLNSFIPTLLLLFFFLIILLLSI